MSAFTTRSACLALGAALLMSCHGNLGPGDALAGSWVTPEAQLVAGDHGLTFTERCLNASFAPVVLDGDGKFHVQSLTFEQGGNVQPWPGETMELQGELTGKVLRLQLLFHLPGGPMSDPVALELSPGKVTGPLVCNA